MTASVSAIEASGHLYAFFFNGGPTINFQDIRYLEHNLTVIDFYLKKKRAELEHAWRKKTDEYKLEIRDGHVGVNLSSNGTGPNYELVLPPGEGVRQLVAVDVQRPSLGSPSRMLLG
jgi:hypothetical protein